MNRQYEKAMESIEGELEEGSLSNKEYEEACADLRAEARENASDIAEEMYREEMGYF